MLTVCRGFQVTRQIGIILIFGVSSVTAGNLALRQPANMSSALNSTVTASLAVDGSPQGTLYLHKKYWCAATSLSTDPWWRVDLGTSYIVDEVKIVSRVDGDGSGLTNFEIRIGDSLENEGNSNQQCGGSYTMAAAQEKSFYCHPGIRGQYVNIRVPGKSKKLEICEVSVNPNPTENLVLRKSATQSSESAYGVPGRAVDGNSSSVYGNASCSHTAEETNPWWRVDMGTSHSVSEVFLVNRADNVNILERPFNIEIRVGDSLTDHGNTNPLCSGLYSISTLPKASFYCKPRQTGRYLNIRLVGNSMILTLCEVEVYSESRAFLKNKPKTPTTKNVYEGNPSSLLCPEPFGFPEPFVAWVKGGVVLQNSSSDLSLNLTAINQTDDGVAIDCVASNKHGNDYHRFILKVHSARAMCTDFTDITAEARTVFHKEINQESAKNDGDINSNVWYRFVEQETEKPMKLPDSSPDPWACGTQAPGWLRGGHPALEDSVVVREVCFSWNSNNCSTKLPVEVRRCYGYYVYKLQPTSFAVKARYCVEQSAVDHKDVIFKHVTSNNGKQYALGGHVIATERHVSDAMKCMVYCVTEKTCVSFNYHPDSKACELNSSTGSRDHASLEERPGNKYYEKVEKLTIVALN